jgi:hypothetical protein
LGIIFVFLMQILFFILWGIRVLLAATGSAAARASAGTSARATSAATAASRTSVQSGMVLSGFYIPWVRPAIEMNVIAVTRHKAPSSVVGNKAVGYINFCDAYSKDHKYRHCDDT